MDAQKCLDDDLKDIEEEFRKLEEEEKKGWELTDEDRDNIKVMPLRSMTLNLLNNEGLKKKLTNLSQLSGHELHRSMSNANSSRSNVQEVEELPDTIEGIIELKKKQRDRFENKLIEWN